MSAEEAKGCTAVEAEEGSDAAVGLQLGLVDVEVHAVDAFDFQGHVLLEDFGDGTWYTHGWLRSSRPLGVNQPLCGSNWGCLEHTPS